MFSRMDVILRKAENVPVVPATALLYEDSSPYVYVVNNKTAHQRIVKLGLMEGDRHEVSEGLSAGDIVVVKGQRTLKQGDAVEFAEEVNR
jgi:multidrug efflux pump subunit AcrA (membrane-fusion protein)